MTSGAVILGGICQDGLVVIVMRPPGSGQPTRARATAHEHMRARAPLCVRARAQHSRGVVVWLVALPCMPLGVRMLGKRDNTSARTEMHTLDGGDVIHTVMRRASRVVEVTV